MCVYLLFAVWQYLKCAELHKVVDNSNNPWHKLVATSEHLQGMMIQMDFCVFVIVGSKVSALGFRVGWTPAHKNE